MATGNSKVVYAALAGNLAIAVTKFAASFWTGSSAMLSEAIHSTVDTGNQGLLLLGMKRAAKPPSRRHPFGHGMELYFWAFVVALLIFSLGGAVSIYEGVQKIRAPEPIQNAWINFVVIGASMLFEGYSFRVALREIRGEYPDRGLWESVRLSKDPTVFAVLLEDAAALMGLAIAAIGLGLAEWLDAPILDGVSSVAIGCVLVIAAVALSNETRSLLTGESASKQVLGKVRSILEGDPRVKSADEILSLHLGPNEVLLAVTIDFREDLSGEEVETASRDLIRKIEEARPEVTRAFLRPRTSPHPGSANSASARKTLPTGAMDDLEGPTPVLRRRELGARIAPDGD
jgi:cation diffusion facilitator family transporter